MPITNLAEAVRVGVQAAVATYRQEAIVPQIEYGYEWYTSRLSRYWLYESYETNTAYSSFNTQSLLHKQLSKLYKNIDGIYNPVARLVNLYKAYIYGGSIDFEHMTAGAIPIVSDDEALLEAIRQVFTWSQWGQSKSLYVRNGTVMGDSPIWICDDRERQKVRMEILHPSRVRQAEFDEVDNVKSAVIEYRRCDEEDLTNYKPGYSGYSDRANLNKYYTYTMTATKDEFVTYKNGQEFAFYKDVYGKPVSRWDNEYGFIPLIIGQHMPTNTNWAANAFYNCVPKIDKINDEASLLHHSIRKIIIPALYGAGVSANKKDGNVLSFSNGEETDIVNLIYGPKDTSLTPIDIPIDIPGTISNIAAMLKELEYDLPILAMQKVRDGGSNLTAPGIKSGYSDAIGMVTEAMGQYDHSQVKALQMAISIGGYNGYEGFDGFGLDSYDRGDLEFWIKDRPVIADELGRSEKITFLSQVNGMSPPLQKIALTEMNYTDEDIQLVVGYSVAKEQQTQANAQQMQQQLGQGQNQPGSVPQLPSGQPQNGEQKPPVNNASNPAVAKQMGRLSNMYNNLGIGKQMMGANA